MLVGWLSVLFLAVTLSACATSHPERTRTDKAAQSEIERKAIEITAGAKSARERAQRIFAFVRDDIEYGFTRRFDEADPAFTLRKARGHCNPQTELLVELMLAAGIPARQRFVTIDPDILDGLLPVVAKPLEELNHSFAEVRLGDQWIRIDGYAVDPALWWGARERLAENGLEAGWGVHRDSCISWDGESDCMGQFVDPEWTRQLHDPIEPARSFYEGPEYTQRMRGLTGFLYRNFGVTWMNLKLDRLRRKADAQQGLTSEESIPVEAAMSRAGG